jgi:hypothetical protein
MMKGFFIYLSLELKTKENNLVLLEHLGVIDIVKLVGMDEVSITISNHPNWSSLRPFEFEEFSFS